MCRACGPAHFVRLLRCFVSSDLIRGSGSVYPPDSPPSISVSVPISEWHLTRLRFEGEYHRLFSFVWIRSRCPINPETALDQLDKLTAGMGTPITAPVAVKLS